MAAVAHSSAASGAPGISLRPYQVEQIEAVMGRLARGERSTLVSAATGCHRAGQLILMHDGSTQRVEDIVVGDQLMGPDGTPRTVLQLARGRQEMVEIRPTKGDPWVVNLDHVLSLVETNTGKPGREGGRIVDVTVREWLTWHRYAKHTHKLFRVGVEFPYRGPPRIDAYALGVLLGDGSLKNGITVTAADREIWTACEPEAKRWGMRFVPLTPADRCHGFRFSAETSAPGSNRMLKHLDALGLRVDASAKFIPDVYKFGLPLDRCEVLAGLIDTDGHMRDGGFELTSKSKQLADDVAFVARSLGLAAYVRAKSVRYTYRGRTEARTFWRVSISGDCSIIPCRVFRKRAPVRVQRKDVLRTGFTVVPTGTVEDYYGFALDGDQRYLLGDFTVTHNTGKTIGIAELTRLFRSRGVRVLIVVNRDELVKQTVRKCEALGLTPDIEKGQSRASTLAKVVIASVQTLKGKRLARWARNHFDLVIIDECHHAAAASYRALLAHFVDAKVVGFTATAVRADGQQLIDPELFESRAHDYDIRTAIRDGNLVPIVARRVVVDGLDLDKVDETRGDFRIEQLSGAMRDARTLRGQVVPLLDLAHDRQTVAFCVDVRHAHDVAALLNDMRPGCARAVSGETDDDEREELLRAHAAGEFQFLTNCDLLVEGYDCLDSDTEILTASGWKGRGQIQVGELVQSLNRETGKLELVPALRYVERPMRVDERMVTLRSQHVNIRTSERHEFHVRHRDAWHTVEGRGLVGRKTPYSLPIAASPEHPPHGLALSNDELRLIAWFMTDGGFENGRLCISQSKETRDEIRDLLKRLALDFTERVRQPGPGAYANARPMHVFGIPRGTHSGSMARRGWAKYAAYLSKNVSPLLHSMSLAQFDVFWTELLKGDGSKGAWLWCDRMEQVDAYTRMAIERGRSTSYAPLVTKNNKTVYRVSVRPNQWLTSNPSDKRAAKAAFEAPSPGETVWCVTNQNSTLVTRRGGKVAIIGNCPSISCVAMLRPTRSWGRLVQCVGRGLRLVGTTYAQSCAAGKRDCLVLITDDGKTPGLQGPADVLLGFGVVPDDLRAELDRLIGTAARPIAEVIDEATSEVEQRREAKTAAELVRWHAEVVDPFVGVEPGPHAGQYGAPTWKREPVTANQLAALEKLGVNVDKIATGKVRMSRAQAWDLLSRLVARKQQRLCTLAQAKRLRGFIETVDLSISDASRLMAAGAKHGWPDGVRTAVAALLTERSVAA